MHNEVGCYRAALSTYYLPTGAGVRARNPAPTPEAHYIQPQINDLVHAVVCCLYHPAYCMHIISSWVGVYMGLQWLKVSHGDI